MHKNGSKISFLWGSLDSTQQATIDNSKSKDTIGPNIVNYVRGDRSNENPKGANYRARKTVMGDIIHSRPLYVDDPDEPRVYVGGNDGMLHAFDADYRRRSLRVRPVVLHLPGASTASPTSRRSSPIPTSTRTSSTARPTRRRPTSRAGRRSWSAASVPAARASTRSTSAIRRRTAKPRRRAGSSGRSRRRRSTTPPAPVYADLGYSYGIPVIAKMNDGNWAAIVGNGYNATGTNQAVLYIIKLIDGAQIRAITTTSPQAVSDTNPNGLSSPTAVDTNRDGKVDYVYAGDINGNLWKFDLTNSNHDSGARPSCTRRPRRSRSPAGRRCRCTRSAATWSTSPPGGCSPAPTRPTHDRLLRVRHPGQRHADRRRPTS